MSCIGGGVAGLEGIIGEGGLEPDDSDTTVTLTIGLRSGLQTPMVNTTESLHGELVLQRTECRLLIIARSCEETDEAGLIPD